MKKINFLFLYLLFTIVVCLNASSAFAGTVTLSWDAPTTNADGTPLTDLAGYKVYYGTSSHNYSQNIDVSNVTTYTVNNLTDGLTYYFAVTAYDTGSNESAYSNEASKTITPQQYTLTVTTAGTGTGTVTSSPTGINCGSDCSETYNAGTSGNTHSLTCYKLYIHWMVWWMFRHWHMFHNNGCCKNSHSNLYSEDLYNNSISRNRWNHLTIWFCLGRLWDKQDIYHNTKYKLPCGRCPGRWKLSGSCDHIHIHECHCKPYHKCKLCDKYLYPYSDKGWDWYRDGNFFSNRNKLWL